MPRPRVHYENLLMDSARWDQVTLRKGDIIISTPPKCGTTWTQMICALLIFQTDEFPRPLDQMSPWVDTLTHSVAELRATVEAQRHRRFLKTHTPLDGLPWDERVTYLCVGRDPRDAAISWHNHMGNVDVEVVMAQRMAALGPPPEGSEPPPPLELPEDPREQFWSWVDSDEPLLGLAHILHHLATFWQARDRPNVVLLHYDDLLSDLEGQMRYLAGRLGIAVPEERWPALVQAASFGFMSRNFQRFAPEKEIWRDPARFFHQGRSGQWRAVLGPEELPRYAARVRTLAAPELADWVHRGPIIPAGG